MRRPLLSLVIVATVSAGCGDVSLPPAGSYSEITVFADGGVEGEWAGRLVTLFAQERDYFVSTEAPFQVTVAPTDRATRPPAVKNLVWCGVLDGPTGVGVGIRDMLGESDVERIRRGGGDIISRPDTPYPGQLSLVITATDETGLRRLLDERGAEIQDRVETSARERLRGNLLSRRDDALSAELRARWGFRLEVPSVYSLYSQSDNPPGVELHRDEPPRVLGVFWRARDHAPSSRDLDELFDFRAEYVQRRYDGDEMDRDRVRCGAGRLGPYPAVCMSGYWYNDRHGSSGGYYETYFVWDQASRLLWAVDLLVYAPGREKTTLVRELRAVAETFRVGS